MPATNVAGKVQEGVGKATYCFAYFYTESISESAFASKLVLPIKCASIARADSRPSLMQRTTSDCPVRISPAANTPF